MTDPGEGTMFSKLGKNALAIILAFSVILLFRWVHFSMSLTRVSEHFIYLTGTEKGIAARVFGIWEAEVYSVNAAQPTQEASCEGSAALKALVRSDLWPTLGRWGRGWTGSTKEPDGRGPAERSLKECCLNKQETPVQSHNPRNTAFPF